MEAFDARGVSFVSITQQFNTTTSMARLTLNVLLSFAQFEREVAGERIRDKIAASKKKGMWMGGLPPLGYDVLNRKLIVNQEEAKILLHIFRRYVEIRSVRALKAELDTAGIRSKRRTFADGTVYGGHKLSRGALYLMLQNRIYRGEITHKGNSYPGEHKAIVDKALWDKVQAVLAENRIDRATGADAKYPSLLAGLAFDESGERLTPTHAVKKGTRYRYYVSRSLITGTAKGDSQGRRIPAGNLETLVIGRLRAFLADEGAMLSAISDAEENGAEQKRLIARGRQISGEFPYAHTGCDKIHSPDARQTYQYQSGARRDQAVSAPASRPDPGTVVGTVFGRPGPYEPPRRYSETQGEGAAPARRPRDEAGRTQRRGSGGCRSRFASDRCSRARLSRAFDTRSRSNRAGDSEPRAAYHRLPLSPAAASFAGTRYRHGNHQRQTSASTQRKAADAAGPQNTHRLGRTAEAPQVSGRLRR